VADGHLNSGAVLATEARAYKPYGRGKTSRTPSLPSGGEAVGSPLRVRAYREELEA